VSPLVARIIAAVFWRLGWRIALIAHREWTQYYRDQIAHLPPEDRKSWSDEWVKDFTPNEGSGTFAGPGIVLDNAIDPYKGDGKVY